MTKNIICLVLSSAALVLARAADDGLHSLGWLNQDPRAVSWLKEDKPDALRSAPPLAVDHSGDMPPVGNQGSQPSCTAWALCYYYKTYQEWLEHGWSVLDTAHRFSPAFAYNQACRGGDIGSYASDVMKVLVDQGCANLVDCPYRAGDRTTWPSETAYYRALPYRCQAAFWIDCRTDPGIENLKRHIADGDNAVLGIYVWANFDNINNFDTTYCVADKYGSNRGGHQVCIVGYDDGRPSHDGPGAFKLVNSWGTGWGNRGYFWMSYVAVKNTELSGRWACYLADRNRYSPAVIARFQAGHPLREWISLTAGIGPSVAPQWTKEFYNWQLGAQAGNPFPNHPILLDLSDGAAYLNPYDTNSLFLQFRDNLTDGITGIVHGVSSVHRDWGAYSPAPETLTVIPDDGALADILLTLPTRRLHWQCAHHLPSRTGLTRLTGDFAAAAPLWSIRAGTALFSSPALGDLDGDGRQEIVVGAWDGAVLALNGEDGETLWSYPTSGGIASSPCLGDIDGDGRLEVVIGSDNDSLYALNAEDGSRLWAFGAGGPVASWPGLADLDGDGLLEVAFGSFDHKVYAANGESGSILWSYETGDTVTSSPALGDIDADGEPEVVVGSRDHKLYALNGSDGSRLWSFLAGGPIRSTACIADIDGDGRIEVVFGSDDNNLYAVSGENDSLLWSCPAGDGIVSSPALGDLDGDGRPEIVVGGLDRTVRALNGEDGSALWAYPARSPVVSSPAIADVNGDASLEVVVGCNDSAVYCLGGPDGTLRWAFPTQGLVTASPALGDLDGDGYLEIVVGGQDGWVYALNGLTSPVCEAKSPALNPGSVKLSVVPNPFPGAARIEYSVPAAGWVRLSLLDAAGRLVLALEPERKEPGNYRVVLTGQSTRKLARGVYFCRLQVGEQALNRKVVLSRD